MPSTEKRDTRGETTPRNVEELVREHLPLVRKIAGRAAARAPSSVTREELFCAGALGLVDSVTRDQETAGPAFTSYLRTRIRGAIVDELRAQDWLPRRARARNERGEVRDGAPNPVAVLRFDDLPPGPAREPASTDEPRDPLCEVERRRERACLLSALEQLDPRDRMVLRLHYFRGMRLKEIGRLLGVSEARVSQIHHRALGRLRPMVELAA